MHEFVWTDKVSVSRTHRGNTPRLVVTRPVTKLLNRLWTVSTLMKVSEMIEAMKRVGLSPYEASIFVNLACAGEVTAGELARASGVNRVQTYRALESLEARGLVEVTVERPRRFAARAIQDAFDMIIDEKRSELDLVETTLKQVLDAWARLTRGRAGPASIRLQVIKGRPQIYRALRKSVAGAEHEVLAFTTTKGLQRSYRAGINEALVAAMKRGVKARLIMDISSGNRSLVATVARHVPLRHSDGQRGRFILIDRSSILAFLIQDEATIRGEAETAIWTNSADFVKAHLEFFEQAWSSGTAAAVRLRTLARA